ncbi:DUF1295 domain-containing protein [Smaragdicoccus niigatensis]|uniref:DUF1295 domain-containing protein n=1 Tax=Smaragdicoccus niigatensis TaxID=359359 RepID=UPI000378E44B|nr:DUF1295 domain-containing protein [Smaragdicoccus niigatensis]
MNLALIGAANLLVVSVVLALTFMVGERLARHNVVDVAWGLAFAAIAINSAVLGAGDPARKWLIAVLVTAWGLRLAVHLAVRSQGHGEDPRYEAFLAKSRLPRRVGIITRVYVLQGVLIWVISVPVQLSATLSGEMPAWAMIGVALWLVGLVFEAVGDAQLRTFKLEPDNQGRVIDSGLWRYTRHPNYFGDACLWWGLYLVALTAGPIVLVTIFAPIVMTTLLVRVSGKALLERHLEGRPGYAEYVRRTSGFIPWWPRRAAS